MRTARRRMRRVLTAAAATLALTGGIAVNETREAQAACGPLTDKSVSGTIVGEDGRAANAVVGFTFVDIFGFRLDARGCRLEGDAYGRSVHLNATLPASGGLAETGWSNNWWIDRIPANVREVWIESYPKRPDGKTDYTHYSGVVRPKVLPGTRNVNLRFPVTCAAGGRTGAIAGTVTLHGQRITPDWIGYWSESESSPQMGYALGVGSNGGFVSPPLSSSPAAGGKPHVYGINMYYKGRFIFRGNVPVHPCRTTTLNIVEP